MDKKSLEIYKSIQEFVGELAVAYPSDKGVALYNRLLHSPHMNSGFDAIAKHISPFDIFFEKYGEKILDKDEPVDGAKIHYNKSEKIVLDISKYLEKGDKPTRDVIKQHLRTIRIMINPSEDELRKMEESVKEMGIDTSSKEGAFIHGILDEAKGAMEGMEGDDPAMAIGSLLSSGIVQKMIGGLQQGMNTGELDMGKLFGTMQTAMGALMKQQGADAQVENKLTILDEGGAGQAEPETSVGGKTEETKDEKKKAKKAKSRAREKAKKAKANAESDEKVEEE